MHFPNEPLSNDIVLTDREREWFPKHKGHAARRPNRDIHRVDGRYKFWTRVDGRLAGFVPEDRMRFAAALEVLVPRPTTEELAALCRPTDEQVRRAEAISAARAKMVAFRAARANNNHQETHKA